MSSETLIQPAKGELSVLAGPDRQTIVQQVEGDIESANRMRYGTGGEPSRSLHTG